MISERDRQILEQLPGWNPAEDIAAQRRAWEELARTTRISRLLVGSKKMSSCARAFAPT